MSGSRPDWQLPPGVTRGLWDYVRSDSIAAGYAAACDGDSLCKADEDAVLEALLPRLERQRADPAADRAETQSQPPTPAAPKPFLVGDFGCGTGRHALALAKAGCAVLAVDLSLPMLRETRKAAEAAKLAVDTVQANLVELDCLADGGLDAAICMFSTWGMIRGRTHRRRALAHLRRVLKPDGVLILHVHSVGSLVWSRLAATWLPGHLLRVLRGREEFGDTVSAFHAVPNFFLHFFSWREVRRELAAVGLKLVRRTRLSTAPVRRLPPNAWALPGSVSGWIVEAVPG